MKNIKISNCRLCKSKDLKLIKDLGNFYVSNFVKKEEIKKSKKCKLKIIKCLKCELIQLEHTAPMDLMYSRHYWYKSGVTNTITKDLRQIADIGKKYLKKNKNNVVLDIGANDGTYLNNFKSKKYFTIGCEPANNLIKELKKSTKNIINDFWNEKNFFKITKQKSDLTTAIGMFYDLEEPNKFILDVKNTLSNDGIFIAQLMCLNSMLEKNDLGNICHEHLEFYSYKTLKFLFENNGLEIFKVEENKINGGSYRIFARHLNKGSIPYKEEVSEKRINKFFSDISLSKNKTVNFMKNEIKKGKKILIYGASTKGNTILQYFGIDNNMIKYAADRSPFKWGKFTVGTGIEIISEKKARSMNPDYFLVLPWGFLNEFIIREKQWRSKGGRFIVPFPEFKIV